MTTLPTAIATFGKFELRRKAPRQSRAVPLRFESLEARQLLATVTLNTDLGVVGELRTTVAAAVAGETIDFALGLGNETIVLTQGPLLIDKALTIDGDNSGGSGTNVTWTNNGASRVAAVDDGNGTINSFTADLRHLTITGGSDVQGGGLFNAERLTLNDVTVRGNRAIQPNTSLDAFGGGILNNGALTLTNSQVDQNTAQFAPGGGNSAFGGGIASIGVGSELHLVDSVVSQNETIGGGGGGIFTRLGAMTIQRSQISENRAGLDTTIEAVQRYDYGGGISVYSQGPGNTFVPLDVTITDSTISGNVLSNDGLTSLVFPYGGGLFARGQGTVTISHSSVSGNAATGNNLGYNVISRGGGMFIYGDDNGTLYVDVTGSTIDNNYSFNQGGAIAIRGRSTDNGNPLDDGPVRFTIDSTSISNNTAGQQGGAIFNWALSADVPDVAQLRISNSTLSGNATLAGSGGVLRNTHGGVLYLENCTVNGNSSANNGGVTWNAGLGLSSGQLPPKLVIRNSTLSGNQAVGNGGAIYSYDGTLELFQSTLSGNTAQGRGGGLYLATFGSYAGTSNEAFSSIERSTMTLNNSYTGGGGIATNYYHSSTWANSIVSGNIGPAGFEDIDLSFSSTVSYSYSLIGGNAMLGPLTDNGGPTLTHLPQLGSPVIDAADPLATGTSDQRGFEPRVVGSAMDMGSVEVDASATVSCDFNNDGQCNIHDIDALIMEIATGGNDPLFDLNGDNTVNLLDRDDWLALAGARNLPCGGAYPLADFNLDGATDGSDFGIWNSNKFLTTGLWSEGDANASGSTDGSDFGIWNSNKFVSACNPLRSPKAPLESGSPERWDDVGSQGTRSLWAAAAARPEVRATALTPTRTHEAMSPQPRGQRNQRPEPQPVSRTDKSPPAMAQPVAFSVGRFDRPPTTVGRQDDPSPDDRRSAVFAEWGEWS